MALRLVRGPVHLGTQIKDKLVKGLDEWLTLTGAGELASAHIARWWVPRGRSG